MSDRVVKMIASASTEVGADVILIITSVMLASGFVVDLVLGIKVVGYGIKKRAWYVIYGISVSAIGYTMSEGSGNGAVVLGLLIAELLIYVIPLYTVREKEGIESKEFIEYIDSEIERSSREKERERNYREKRCGKEIDYSYVKGVIERLKGKTIGIVDKREIEKLEENVERAETGENSEEIKERINDGLGKLIKIMAKYGA